MQKSGNCPCQYSCQAFRLWTQGKISRSENGFWKIASRDPGIDRGRTQRLRQARVWQFRYNGLPGEAFRVILDESIQPGMFEWISLVGHLNQNATRWQGAMLSTGSKWSWWTKFVSDLFSVDALIGANYYRWVHA